MPSTRHEECVLVVVSSEQIESGEERKSNVLKFE
jgi:hypothetical protein